MNETGSQMFGQNAVLGVVSQGGNGHVRMGIGD